MEILLGTKQTLVLLPALHFGTSISKLGELYVYMYVAPAPARLRDNNIKYMYVIPSILRKEIIESSTQEKTIRKEQPILPLIVVDFLVLFFWWGGSYSLQYYRSVTRTVRIKLETL